jgi:hypothetical protein
MSIYIKNYFALFIVLFSNSILADSIHSMDLWGIQKNDPRPLVLDQYSEIIPKQLHQHNKEYKINIRYPFIQGTKLTAADEHFNLAVLHIVNKSIGAFKQDLKNNVIQTMTNRQSNLNINYEMSGFVSQSQKTQYVSVRFTIKGSVKGMAHPYQNIQVLNYDLGHDHLLALSDLFQSKNDYLAKIAAYSAQQLQGKNIPEDMVTSGTAPTQANYKNWNMTLSGLLITFDEAQVAPRYFGAQEIVIPNAILKESYTHAAACTMSIINCDGT